MMQKVCHSSFNALMHIPTSFSQYKRTKNIDMYKIICNLVNSQIKKYVVKCLMCDEVIEEPLSPNFAEPHITTNPGHLEYRIIVEMPSTNAPKDQPTLVFDDDHQH
jgi:hypothetical protein